MFLRNIDPLVVQRFKAAAALDGKTLREVAEALMKDYADKRFQDLEKNKPR